VINCEINLTMHNSDILQGE